MSKLWILTRIFLKSTLSSLSKNKKTKVPPYLMMILMLIIFGASFSAPLGLAFGALYDLLAAVGQQGTLLTLAIVGISVATFIFGIFYVLGIFYFAKDVELLLPLPLKSSQVLGAKFISVLIYEYITELIILLPAIVVFGIKSSAGVTYYIYSFVLFLLIPVIPLVMASLINLVVMRFTNIGKHKDALRIIGGLTALIIGMGINFSLQVMGRGSGDPQAIIKLITAGENSLIGLVSKVFPSAKLASLAMVHSSEIIGVINLLLFIAITGAFVLLFFIVAEALYFKGALGNSEVYSKRKKLSKEQLEKTSRQNSALKAYLLKELKILFRTPAYVMNCVISNFIWPIVIAIGLFSSGSLNDPELAGVMELFKNTKFLGVILVSIFAASVIISGGNGIASTTISREGQNIYVSKYIPIKFRDQVLGRIFASIILSFLAIVIVLVAMFALVDLPLIIIVPTIVVVFLGMLLTSFIGLLLDLRFPKLNWDNEQKAVKQNINFIITMFGSFAIAALSVYLVIKFKLELWYAFSAITAVFGLLDIALYYTIMNAGKRWFNRIEV